MQRLAVDQDGNIYAAGNSFSSELSSGTMNGFMMKMSKTGISIWGMFFGATDYDKFVKFALDTNGVYITGHSNSDSLSQGDFDMIALKLDPSNGDKLWAISFGGSSTEE